MKIRNDENKTDVEDITPFPSTFRGPSILVPMVSFKSLLDDILSDALDKSLQVMEVNPTDCLF